MDLPFSQQMTNTTDRGWQENNSNEMKNYYYRAVMSGFYFPGEFTSVTPKFWSESYAKAVPHFTCQITLKKEISSRHIQAINIF
ncbi:uncharacterized protein LOC143256811 isoform X2 [Tachypleus tridentatus]|uniref:uncharacterized protein LOC143256811 isoform X2 n=1 Tax=Tachypleus tridentatus TaxID=6853 RepID=UPI003FCF90E1